MSTTVLAILATFNLSCSVTYVSSNGGGNVESSVQLIELRIDTKKMRWCEADCQRSRPIDKLLDTMLVLVDSPKNLLTGEARGEKGSFYELRTVHREDGTYTSDKGVFGGSSRHGIGHCKVIPFTGLPTPKF